MKILILGAGGTGGFFGGRLVEAGADVTFLVRERRAKQLAENGLQIESPNGSVILSVNTVSSLDVKPQYDIIILCCKSYDLDASIAAIKPAMHAETMIVPLLNGISHLNTLDAAFGRERVLGGCCQIVATLTEDGVVKSMTDIDTIIFGAREVAHNAHNVTQKTRQQHIANQLGEAFAKSTTSYKVSDNIMLDMWEKIAFLSTLAGITCLMRASIGDIMATPNGPEIIQSYINTSMAIATAEGYAPRQHVRERFEKILTTKGSSLTASMLRDLENRNQVEADHIVGYMLAKAREHGIDDRLIAIAHTHLKAYQLQRQTTAAPNKTLPAK